MSKKRVESVIAPRAPHFVGDGFRVHNFIPSALSMERMSPFIMLDYNSKHYFPPADEPRGVDVHPHRGFETVTIAYKGRIAHHDSRGGAGVIREGDVQWMTAAAGILHKEYHEEAFSKAGGDFQMVQLWVNLPAQHKMSPPKYQAITNHQIAKVPIQGGEVEVIAGSYKGTAGAASTFTPVHVYNVRLHPGAKADFDLPAHYHTAILVIEGAIIVNGEQHLAANHLAVFGGEGDIFTLEGTENAIVLVLSGEPILEPIAAHGPFVMNTRAELMEAFVDYNNGKFGVLN